MPTASAMDRVDVLAKPCVVNSSAAASRISSRAVAAGREGCWWQGRPGPAVVTASFLHHRAAWRVRSKTLTRRGEGTETWPKQDVYPAFTGVKLFGHSPLENYQVTGNLQPSAERCSAGRLCPHDSFPAPEIPDDINRSSHRPPGRCRPDVP